MLEFDRHAIKRLRTERGLSHKEFGEIVGMKPQQVQQLEKHEGYPNLRTVLRIANGFGLSLDFFLIGETTARAVGV